MKGLLLLAALLIAAAQPAAAQGLSGSQDCRGKTSCDVVITASASGGTCTLSGVKEVRVTKEAPEPIVWKLASTGGDFAFRRFANKRNDGVAFREDDDDQQVESTDNPVDGAETPSVGKRALPGDRRKLRGWLRIKPPGGGNCPEAGPVIVNRD